MARMKRRKGSAAVKKRILLVSSGRLDHSGVPAVIMTLVRQLGNEFAFDLLTSADNAAAGPLDAEFLRYGGRILCFPRKRFRSHWLNRLAELFRPLALYRRTRAVLRAENYQAIHCHNEFDMAGPLAAAARQGVPVRLAQTHKTWKVDRPGPLTRAKHALLRRIICRRATALLGPSRQANAAFYGADAPARSVGAPYDDNRFTCDGGHPPGGRLWIAQVGYFCDNKNQRFTLEVFSRLAAAIPDAKLFLVGDDRGDYQTRLLEAVHHKGLDERVTLLPADTDIPALLRECTLLLFPSRAEGFGIVLIEAQAIGLFCYASDTVPPETNRGGVTFLPLSAGPDAWADAILRDRRYEHRMACDCSPFASAAFAGQFRDLYRA